MALMLLRVFLVGVLAAAADDVPITWWPTNHAELQCVLPLVERLQPRRPPPPLDADDRPRSRPYLWRKGDEEVSPKRVSPTGALEVSRRGRREGEGIYQCLVRHYGGLVLGYPTHLKFASMDKQFSEHPGMMTVRSGQSVVISCSISSAPPANFSWLRHEVPLPENDRYHILQNQLLITDVASEDEGQYRCKATNTYLNKTRTSLPGRLQISADVEDQALGFLPVEVDTKIAMPRGSRVVMPCPVVGTSKPKLIWNLIPPSGRPMELDVTDEVFVIKSLEPDQEGNYSCQIERTDLVKTFSVTLTEPAKIVIPPTSRETLRASTVRFNCSATGKPEPTITWYKDGQPLEIAGRINLRKSVDDDQRTELVISGVTSDDAGVYQCFAQNVAGIESFWAILNVTGADAAAPTNVQCWPVSYKEVKVKWEEPTAGKIVAYTVHGTPEDANAGNSLPGHPLKGTEELVEVKTPLVPYVFQVRAYSRNVKSSASDLSTPAVCQGQGVPIRIAKLENDQVIVSWKKFAEMTPGVVQWILQTKRSGQEERNITLDGAVYNYTLTAPPSSPLLVRLLGSRSVNWLQQDLSLIPWSSTAHADDDLEAGDVTVIPKEIEVTSLNSRDLSVTWQCDECDARFSYMVCLRSEDADEICRESKMKYASFDGLLPNTEYKVIVQARMANRALGGPFSTPYNVVTPPESPLRFRDLKAHYVNSSAILVSWNGEPSNYTVHYSSQLILPVEQWDAVHTNGSSALVPVIDPNEKTYLMVIGYDPTEHSNVETVPPYSSQPAPPEDIHYEYTSSGIRLWWKDQGPRVVSYAQNLSRPVDDWVNIVIKEPTATGIVLPVDPSLITYVMVTQDKMTRGQVLTIAPAPYDDSWLHFALGIGLGVLALLVLALTAVCIWQRRKKSQSPVRSRRRNAASNAENAEEGAEMNVVGGRLSSAGARDAGEPLLNGHVHITENPTSKTPNGKMKKARRYEAAFDVSRYEDPNTTLETTLDADTSTASYNLLDTSRRPELDLSRSSRNISANNSFAKLPDDNMNSELTRSSFQLDNSKIQPTLQPNG